MKVFFRVDSSTLIGSGHLMRCLTLADSIKQLGGKVSFICCDLPGNISNFVKLKGYNLKLIQNFGDKSKIDILYDIQESQRILSCEDEIDWLIIDHYEIDEYWEKKIRPFVKKIMVIDDLANRKHDCDLLLDQNFYINMEKRYHELVPYHCIQLLGPKYLLLRPEFKKFSQINRKRDGIVKNILVFFSGTDPTNETIKSLEAIQKLDTPHINYDIVVGAANSKKDIIQDICKRLPNVKFYCQVENMAEMVYKADLALGAGGTAMWERCYLGLPSIVIIIAENQLKAVNDLSNTGAVYNLGWHEKVTSDLIANSINKAINSPTSLQRMSKKCLELMINDDMNLNSVISELF